MCGGISDLIQEKTRGNVLFVVQLLRALYEDQVLTVGDNGGWLWDDNKWHDYQQDTTVLDMMVRRIRRLPRDCQTLLSTAAFLGAVSDAKVICVLMADNIVAFEDSL
jgi:predicted ATPase